MNCPEKVSPFLIVFFSVLDHSILLCQVVFFFGEKMAKGPKDSKGKYSKKLQYLQ